MHWEYGSEEAGGRIRWQQWRRQGDGKSSNGDGQGPFDKVLRQAILQHTALALPYIGVWPYHTVGYGPTIQWGMALPGAGRCWSSMQQQDRQRQRGAEDRTNTRYLGGGG
jgi:hypothetical protein